MSFERVARAALSNTFMRWRNEGFVCFAAEQRCIMDDLDIEGLNDFTRLMMASVSASVLR